MGKHECFRKSVNQSNSEALIQQYCRCLEEFYTQKKKNVNYENTKENKFHEKDG